MNKAPTLPEIDGVDILAKPERGAKAFAGPFYTDQFGMMAEMARSVRDRSKPGMIFIAPEDNGFTIFKRRSAK